MDQITIAICGPLSILLAMTQDKKIQRWAPVVGCASQAAWFYTLYVHQQWGAFIAGFFYSGGWLFGIYNHWIKETVKHGR